MASRVRPGEFEDRIREAVEGKTDRRYPCLAVDRRPPRSMATLLDRIERSGNRGLRERLEEFGRENGLPDVLETWPRDAALAGWRHLHRLARQQS